MRAWSVVRLSPSSAAAPRGPPMTQLRDLSAHRIASRWTSSRVGDRNDSGTAIDSEWEVVAPTGGHGVFGSPGTGGLWSHLGSRVNVADSQTMTERLTTFSSSRTLPGHE